MFHEHNLGNQMKMVLTINLNIDKHQKTLANKDLDGFAVRLDDSLGFFVAFLPHCKAARALVENPVLYQLCHTATL